VRGASFLALVTLAGACVLPDYAQSSGSGGAGGSGGGDVCGEPLTQGIGTSSTDELGVDLVTGPDDSTIVVGEFTGTIEYITGEPINSIGADVFIAKIASDGAAEWVTTISGNGDQHASSIVTGADGGYYVTGTFDNEVAIADDAPIPTAGSVDAFVARIDPDGTVSWIDTFGGPAEDYAVDAAALSSGIVVVGHFRDQITIDGELLPDQTAHPPDTFFDLFAVKVSTEGAVLAKKAFTEGGEAYASSVAARADGTFYLSGYYRGKIALGGTSGAADSAGLDAFVAKLDGDLNDPWSRRYGAGGDEVGGNIIATSDGYVLSGTSSGALDPIDFGGVSVTPTDVVHSGFVARLEDKTNAGSWARLVETAAPGIDPQVIPESLAITGNRLLVSFSVFAPVLIGSEAVPDGVGDPPDAPDPLILALDLTEGNFVGKASYHAPLTQRITELAPGGCGLAFVGFFDGSLLLPDTPKVESTGRNLVVGRLSPAALLP